MIHLRALVRFAPLIAILLVHAACLPGVDADAASLQVLALSGTRALDNEVHTGSFSRPVMNDAGQVAFRSRVRTPDGMRHELLLRVDGRNSAPVDLGSTRRLPGSSQRYVQILSGRVSHVMAIDDVGDVVFVAIEEGNVGGVYREPSGTDSTPAPVIPYNSSGTINGEQVTLFPEDDPRVPAIASGGYVGLGGRRAEADGTRVPIVGIVNAGGEILRPIVHGEDAPNGVGQFWDFTNPAIHAGGEYAFRGEYRDLNSVEGVGIYKSTDNGLLELARTGMPTPDGFAVFDTRSYRGVEGFDFPGINDNGLVGFAATLTESPITRAWGVYLADENGLFQVARSGLPAPGGGIFSEVRARGVNNTDQLLFVGITDGFKSGYYIGDTTGAVRKIVRDGDEAPNGGVLTLPLFSDAAFHAAFNDVGEAAIVARIRSEGSFNLFGDEAILHATADGVLTEVIREGEEWLGSTVTRLFFANQYSEGGPAATGFNNAGQIAFQFVLEDGRSGIALYTPVPEPSAAAVAAVIGLAWAVAASSRRVAGP